LLIGGVKCPRYDKPCEEGCEREMRLIAALVILVIVSTQIVPVNASHYHTHSTKSTNLPCCETGVGAHFGIDCGPAVCGFGVITGSGK
jgi:hypothetical protein